MGETDPVLAHLDRVDQAAQELHRELGVLCERMRITRALRSEGLLLSQALAQSPAPASHEVVAAQVERYVEALHDYRCAIVRQLVDEEGWSLAAIAERTGCARQVISRLYHAPDGAGTGVRPCPKLQLHATSGAASSAR